MRTQLTYQGIPLAIEGCPIWDCGDGWYEWLAFGRVDVDGSGSAHGDTCYQPDTSLHRDGDPLNADVDRYIVAPPQVCLAVPGVVLGCMAVVSYQGRVIEAVVGDVGPQRRIGEMSYACAMALRIPPSPVSGGVDSRAVLYRIRPGVPAEGYALQPYGPHR